MAKVKSISISEISRVVRSAVAKINASAAPPDVAILRGDLSGGPLVGFIVRDVDLDSHSVAELNQLATNVTKSLPGTERMQPTAVLRDGHIIIGFTEESSVVALKE
jgi:hypothetical protein